MSVALFICGEKNFTFVLTGCGSVVDNTLVSPGYPNNYPDRMHCVYNVPISQGKALKIYFQMFDLEPSFSCG